MIERYTLAFALWRCKTAKPLVRKDTISYKEISILTGLDTKPSLDWLANAKEKMCLINFILQEMRMAKDHNDIPMFAPDVVGKVTKRAVDGWSWPVSELP